MTDVTVYTQPGCNQCVATKLYMNSKHVDFRSIDLSKDPDRRDELMALGFRSMPIIIWGDESWSGFRPDKIDARLA